MTPMRSEPQPLPQQGIVADAPPVARRIDLDAPWRWLDAGWRDMWRTPHISLAYGFAISAAALLIAFGLWLLGQPVTDAATDRRVPADRSLRRDRSL